MSDELDPAAQALVASARRSGRALESGRRARLRGAVVAAAASSTVAVAAASASVGKLVLVGVVSAALGSGATLLAVRMSGPTPEPKVAPYVAPAAVPRRKVEAAAPPTVIVEVPVANPPGAARPVAPPVAPTTAPIAASSPPPQTPDVRTAPVNPPVALPASTGLAAELQLIRGAMAATQAQQWVEAQRLLDEHERRFGSPQLRSEARAMQVVVWCGVGRVGEARQLARELERTDALNPAVQRLHTSCAW